MNVDKEKLAAEVIKHQNGDGKAFEAIYNMTNQAAYFTALKIVKNEDDAQDVLQDSYVKVLDKLSTLDKPESFMSWFNMLVANTAKNYLAKNNPVLFADEETEMYVLESIPEENEVYVPGNSVEKDELCDDVMSLIDSLSDDKRTAVVLYYYDEMTTKQIAESLGVNENTVKSRLVQAKKDLAAGIRALEKKNKSILGIAPMSVVRWALNYNGSDAYQKELPDFAPLLEKIQGLESHGFSVLEKLKFRVADLFSHFGTGAGTHHDKGAVFKSAAAVVATAGVVGGAVAGTNAIKNRDKPDISETTTAYVQEIESKQKTESSQPEIVVHEKEDDRTFVLVDKDKKKIDADINSADFGFGVDGYVTTYNVRKPDGTVVTKEVNNLYRKGYNASYSDLLPYAQNNRVKYDSYINNTLDEINKSRSGPEKLELSDKLTEQANVRALEIAYSDIELNVRPDGTTFRSMFDENGYTSGGRYEITAYDCDTPEQAIEKITGTANASVISDPLVSEIGVGVAENPEDGKLVFVVHLYSPDGEDDGEYLIQKASLKVVQLKNDINDFNKNSADKMVEFVQNTPVLKEIGRMDNPLLDPVMYLFDEIFDN